MATLVTLELKTPQSSISATRPSQGDRILVICKLFLASALVAALWAGTAVTPSKPEEKLAFAEGNLNTQNPRTISTTIGKRAKISESRNSEQDKQSFNSDHSDPAQVTWPSRESHSMLLACHHNLSLKVLSSLENPFPACEKLINAQAVCDRILFEFSRRTYLLAYATAQYSPELSNNLLGKALRSIRKCDGRSFTQLIERIQKLKARLP